VRSMSLELSVNPNTVQKAYNELEIMDITYSVPGVGRFVSQHAKQIISKGLQKNLDSLYKPLYEMALAGVTQEAVLKIVKAAYDSARAVVGKTAEAESVKFETKESDQNDQGGTPDQKI
jgi:GntR family transcriptional regulator